MNNITVTTVFSQGATFYAGETLKCTITFKSSPKKASKQVQDDLYRKSSQRSRAQSYSSFDLTSHHRHQQYNTKPTLREVESLSIASLPPSPRLSFSSLASSTFSYLTGSTSNSSESSKHSEPSPNDEKWLESKGTLQMLDVDDGFDRTIQVDDTESLDTQSLQSSSRRSSIDSTTSSVSPFITRRHTSRLHRLSAPLYRSPSLNLGDYSAHLLWGSVQVVGQFVVDPSMLDVNKFASLNSKAMYGPLGSSYNEGGGGGMFIRRSESYTHKKEERCTIPVFSTPPSILFVDMKLAPGETVKYSYKIKLPKNIPPSYRGKSIRFNYYLVIGSQKASSTKPPGAQGQVVQIPFRVFNHVSEDGSRPVYDLMNPEIYYKDQAIVDVITESLDEDDIVNSYRKGQSKSNKQDVESNKFKEYIDNLLSEDASSEAAINKIMQRENDQYDEEHTNNGEYSCRRNVSLLANTSKRVTFDICKNKQRVAQLHFVKTLFRLGEPVQGIIDFEGAVLPTFQISVYLESHEVVDGSISVKQPQSIARLSTKSYAGYHAFCRHKSRLSFSLVVPASESPEFQTSSMRLQYYLKLEFVTGLESHQPTIHRNASHTYHHINKVAASNFDCQIPLHIFGSSNGSILESHTFGGPHMFTVQ